MDMLILKKKYNFLLILYIYFVFVSLLNSLSASEFELDLALGSTYDASTTRSLLGVSSNGEAELTGSNMRFIYLLDETLGYGLRLASHEGEDTKDLTAGYAYKITINETSPFVKFGKNFNEGSDFIFEGFGLAGLNLATMSVSHNILSEVSTSGTGLMLEGGVFAGVKNDDFSFGGGLSLPLDSYKGEFYWNVYGYTLNYDVELKKKFTFYLIFKSEI
jgi:hypothetical protein